VTTPPSGTTIVLALGTAPQEGATVAALRLAEAAMERGHRVAVYAYGAGTRVGATSCATGPHVRALLRRGVHGGRLSWVVDDRDPRTTEQVPGVVRGDASDLWHLVREGDVVLGVTG
jgi:hypothetical protein